MEPNQKRRWLDAYFDDELSKNELVQFEQMLHEDEALLKDLMNESYFHMRLRMEATASPEGCLSGDNFDDAVLLDQLENGKPLTSTSDSEEASHDTAESKAAKSSQWFGFLQNLPGYFSHNGFQVLVIFALLLPSAFAFWLFFSNARYGSAAASNPIVTQTTATRWGGSLAKPIDAGSQLTKGQEYTLKSGLVELLFPNDARVIIHGPTTFAVNTNDFLKLGTGRCVAHVPESAVGFTIEANDTRIVDLGTEFGVEAKNDLETDVYVFQGKVELSLKDNLEGSKIELTENEGVCSSIKQGIIHQTKINEERFVRTFSGQSTPSWYRIRNAGFEQPALKSREPDNIKRNEEFIYWHTSKFLPREQERQNKNPGVGYYVRTPNQETRVQGVTEGNQAAALILQDGSNPEGIVNKDIWIYYPFGKIRPQDVGHTLKAQVDCLAKSPDQELGAKVTIAFATDTTRKDCGTIIGAEGQTIGSHIWKNKEILEAWVSVTHEMVGRELFVVLRVKDTSPGPEDIYLFDNVKLFHYDP